VGAITLPPMPGRAHVIRRTALLFAACVGFAPVGAPAPSIAAPPAGPPAVVTLGDSYISGEAGRWLGNSDSGTSPYDNTDRACVQPKGAGQTTGVTCDPSRVYIDGTAKNGCHRSDVSELLSASLPIGGVNLPPAGRFNIACSGAETINVLRKVSGGQPKNGEQQQADHLGVIARSNAVRMIVLSIGGNDFNFSTIAAQCVEDYFLYLGSVGPFGTNPCSAKHRLIDNARKQLKAKRAIAQRRIQKVIGDIRATMGSAGYAAADYRLVIQTYPAVLTSAANANFGSTSDCPGSASGFFTGRTCNGCPLFDADLTWAHDTALPVIDQTVRAAAAAAATGVEVLDLLHAFDGHAICSKTARKATAASGPSPTRSEWGRFISFGQSGDLQESVHPNAYGQIALGTCLTRLFAAKPGNYSCNGAANRSPSQVVLRPSQVVRRPSQVVLRPSQVVRRPG